MKPSRLTGGTRALRARLRVASHCVAPLLVLGASTTVLAAPVSYTLDPAHTYPSFEADHGGYSYWRGKFNRTSGKLELDRTAGRGTFEAKVDLKSLDFGHDELNQHMIGPKFFDTANNPESVFTGRLTGFNKGVPSRALGTLTLNGQSHPLVLAINRFKCAESPMLKTEVCGANLVGKFDRSRFGLDLGKQMGFDMKVVLNIQVEAIRD